jgi:hypothetical protein
MTPGRRSSRPQRSGNFRRRMILQLTSLLDLLLIIVFVQYLEMQHATAMETERRHAAEAQRDVLLAGDRQRLYEVWEIHLNGNRSVYPDESILVSSATQRRVVQPRSPEDFLQQLLSAMKFSPKPASPCIFLLTWANVHRESLRQTTDELHAAADDPRLQQAWGQPPVKFRVVEGGYLEDIK